jgi:PAS domain S-box-containing protein
MNETDLFSMLQRTADAAFSVDQSGIIRSWNTAATWLFGYTAEEVVGQPCAGIFCGLDPTGKPTCAAKCDVRTCAFGGQLVSAFDLYVRTASGARTWVNMSTLVAGDPASGTALMVHLARDAGARKDREALLRTLVAAGRHAADEVTPALEKD